MVKHNPNNRAKGARRGRRNSPKNVQMKNQTHRSARAAPMRQVGVAQGVVTANRKPRMYQEGDAFVVEHEEYVADVFTDMANVFAYEVYELNPSNATTFPWLADIASRYEECEFEYLNPKFETAAPTTASGKVLLAIDFDPADDTALGTKEELMNDDRTKSAPVWQTFVQTVDRGKLRKRLFVRQDGGSPEDSADKRLQDVGNLFVGTTACSLGASAMLGELWLSYKVRFYTPVLHTAVALTSVTSLEASYSGTTPTTDLLKGINIPANIGDVATLASGIAVSVVDNAAAQLPGLAWVFANTGTTVPTGTTIVKFLKDWAGRIILNVAQIGGATSLPDFTAVGLSPVCELGRASGLGVGPSFTNNMVTDVVRSFTIGTTTGFADYVIDVAAQAGMGIALTAPSFTPSVAYQRDFFAFPTPTNLAAFRAHLNARKNGIVLPRTMASASKTVRALRKDRPAAPMSQSTQSTSLTSGETAALVNARRKIRGLAALSPTEFDALSV